MERVEAMGLELPSVSVAVPRLPSVSVPALAPALAHAMAWTQPAGSAVAAKHRAAHRAREQRAGGRRMRAPRAGAPEARLLAAAAVVPEWNLPAEARRP